MEIALALLIVAATVYLFATEKYPAALVALMSLAVLVLIGLLVPWMPWMRADRWITPAEGVSGFSHPATITVAAMFVLSAGLQKTGAVSWLGPVLGRLAGRPAVLLAVMMLTVAALSAFINNTAAVAVALPIVLTACARAQTAPSRFLIPLSYASQFGGVCTLIGTSTNLLVSSISEQSGRGAVGMFEFAPLGLIFVAVGALYLLIAGRWLLPDRPAGDWVKSYQVENYIAELRVPAGSPLAGRTLRESRFGRTPPARLLAILRGGQTIWPEPEALLQPEDVLLLEVAPAQLMELRSSWKLESEPVAKFGEDMFREKNLCVAEVVVASRSWLIGQTLQEADFRRRYHCLVMGIQGRRPVAIERLRTARLHFGDTLLLLGRREDIARLRTHPDFLMLERVEEPAFRRAKMPLALGIFAGAVALAALHIMPILVSAMFGCIALVATRCLTLEEACEAIDWKVIFLLAGALPIGLAMQKSGAAELLAQGAVALARPWGPVVAVATLYLAAAVLTEFMSNNATAVLLSPVAIATAVSLQVDARPLLMALCFAASTSFATPVGYQTNAMVHHPGGYRFSDFAKVGVPLNLIFWALAVYFIPKFWPF
jgi:di/tricarboxylate transporter